MSLRTRLDVHDQHQRPPGGQTRKCTALGKVEIGLRQPTLVIRYEVAEGSDVMTFDLHPSQVEIK